MPEYATGKDDIENEDMALCGTVRKSLIVNPLSGIALIKSCDSRQDQLRSIAWSFHLR
jgi:hypothetical protein